MHEDHEYRIDKDVLRERSKSSPYMERFMPDGRTVQAAFNQHMNRDELPEAAALLEGAVQVDMML